MAIDLSTYSVTDDFFGAPYIDEDEHLDAPIPHRLVHGGFEGTDTRFTCYFPDEGYDGRFFQPIEGGHGGHEKAHAQGIAAEIMGIGLMQRLGGYMVESNQGHIGDDVDRKGGDDPTIYGHRASAESARVARFIATQVYGQPPHHGYVFGGSGGGRRSPLCLENAPDIYDGAMPYMGGGDIDDHGSTRRIRGAQVMSFASMFNVQRLLGDKIHEVADAMGPGGSGNPYAGLTTHQREELASLYRQGFPMGDEFVISQPFGQIWLWTSIADDVASQDPAYFEDFWTEPGYIGYDSPELVTGDLIDQVGEVTRIITPQDFLDAPDLQGDELTTVRNLALIMAGMSGDFSLPVAIEIGGLEGGYRLGAGVRVETGKAAGRQLYCSGNVGDLFACDGPGDANLLRFTGVQIGDRVRVDNRKFLAFCYFARHHLMEDEQFDALRVDGVPVFTQHPVPLMSPLMGVCYSGLYRGKLLWLHHTHDASLWPPQALIYRDAVLRAQGEAGLADRYRLRWTQNAEHMPPFLIPGPSNRSAATWLIDFTAVIEQSLKDLVAWVEDDVDPGGTAFTYADGQVTLPATATERGGIQPVVSVTADGSLRAEVRVGAVVQIDLEAEVPEGAGRIVRVEWDFDGTGTFPLVDERVDGSTSRVELSVKQAFERVGTHFATARVFSHRDGDVHAENCLIPNLAQARIVVAP